MARLGLLDVVPPGLSCSLVQSPPFGLYTYRNVFQFFQEYGPSRICAGLVPRRMRGSELTRVGVSENRGTLFGGPLKGILFYMGYKRGTPPPILENAHVNTSSECLWLECLRVLHRLLTPTSRESKL